jgi:hypothetical protein
MRHDTKTGKNVPNEHKMYQMFINYPKCPYIKYFKWTKNISTFSNVRPSEIDPNWDFWFENKPSGNPAFSCCCQKVNDLIKLFVLLILSAIKTTYHLAAGLLVYMLVSKPQFALFTL